MEHFSVKYAEQAVMRRREAMIGKGVMLAPRKFISTIKMTYKSQTITKSRMIESSMTVGSSTSILKVAHSPKWSDVSTPFTALSPTT